MSEPVFCARCGWIARAHRPDGLAEDERPLMAGLVQPVCEEFVQLTIDEEKS